MFSRLFVPCILIVFLIGFGAAIRGHDTSTKIQKLDARYLPNAIQIHDKLISGGLPRDKAAFEELSRLGVKTVISVDGMAPDTELASAFGMKYVHLPHGYDGIPSSRVMEIAKAILVMDGPIYIHCHHGRHRSPAAACAGGVVAGLVSVEKVSSILAMAGTNTNYRGLFHASLNARPIPSEELRALAVDFKSQERVPPMAEAMVKIDHYFDKLSLSSLAGWQPPKLTTVQDVQDPVQDSLLLQDFFAELLRTDAVMKRTRHFQESMAASERDVRELYQQLVSMSAKSPSSETVASMNQLLKRISANCKSCHEVHRDNLPK